MAEPPTGLIRPRLLDAAMGTRLIARGLDLRRDDPSAWNLMHPEIVLAIHRLDALAGADALTTNTFGANGLRFDSVHQLETILRAGVRLAREAIGTDRLVLGDMGPVGAPGVSRRYEAVTLIDAGADALLLETFTPDEAEATLKELRPHVDRPILISLFDWPDDPGPIARRLVDRGASAIGVNCRVGIAGVLPTLSRIGAEVTVPLLARPSACLPGEPIESPGSFAAGLPACVALGVRWIGGCCGSDEAHIAALRNKIDAAFPLVGSLV